MHLNYLCHQYMLVMQCRIEMPSFTERLYWHITVLDAVYILAEFEFLEGL